MSILVIVDLELVVCERADQTQYSDLVKRILHLSETYIEWVEKVEARWLYSIYMIDLLLAAYPWDSPLNRHTDLQTWFFYWLQKVRRDSPIETKQIANIRLEPDIFLYVHRDYPELTSEWLLVLACNSLIDGFTPIILSCGNDVSSPICHAKPDQTTLYENINGEEQIFHLIKNQDGWNAILLVDDPWLRHQLPKNGDCPYIPAIAIQPGSHDFPNENKEFYAPRRATCFRDSRNRLWVPDEEGGKRHWDVQCPPYGRNNYIKVAPDGRRL